MDKITMEDIMQWLEAQHTEANARLAALGDGDESHVEYSSDAKAVRIINAIVDRMGEMTAVEYLEALRCCAHATQDFDLIYSRLSNRVNHAPTVRFVVSGYDLRVLEVNSDDCK